MSLATSIGLGYSGYSFLNNVPILMLPSSSPENENILKASGAFHPDPAFSTGQIPAKQRRSLNLTLQTLITKSSMPLVKVLTYGWRHLSSMDTAPEIPFTYVVGNNEGFQGLCYIDEINLTADPESFVTMSINITSWVWTEISSPNPLSKMGTPILQPLSNAHKPIPGWQTLVKNSAISSNSIPLNWSLRLANNWQYQTFNGGFLQAPNPSLITAGNLEVNLAMSWMANRRDRPRESGAVQIQIGTTPILDTIYIDRLIREPRQFEGGGSGDTLIKWSSTFFGQGSIPRSN